MWNLTGNQVSPGTVGVSVEVVPDSIEVCRGEAATGKVILRGGMEERPINRFVAELQEHYLVSSGKSSHIEYRTDQDVTYATEFMLAPGQIIEQPFQSTLPSTARLTSSGRQQGWSVHAFAGISWAKDPWCRCYLNALPERPIQELADALSKLGFSHIDNWSDGAIADMNWRPPERWAPYLDGIKFRCQTVGDDVAVCADVNWQERGITDILKAIVRADHTTHEFSYQSGRPDGALRDFLGSLGLPG